MPEPVGLDAAGMRTLIDRIARTAGDLSAVTIPGVEGLPGSALTDLVGPPRATADVRRLGATVQAWAVAARRTVDELTAADGAGADRLGPR